MLKIVKRIAAILVASSAFMGSCAFASDLSPWAERDYWLASGTDLLSYNVIKQDLQDYITREEFTEMAMNLYRKLTGEGLLVPDTHYFKDSNNTAVDQAYMYGIITGEDDKFYPNEKLTRESMALIICNTLTAAEINFKWADTSDKSGYQDENEISYWAKTAVVTLINNGLMQGSEFKIRPKEYLTREQAIAMVNRAFREYSPQQKERAVPEIYIEDVSDNTLKLKWSTNANNFVLLVKDSTGNTILEKNTTSNSCEIDKNELGNGTFTFILYASSNIKEFSMPTDYTISGVENISDEIKDILETAESYIGTPYLWGGTTPNGFDCSGFVQYVYGQNGYSLTRTTYTQWDNDGKFVSKDDLQPGDLIYFGSSSPSHVGIYIGDGMMIHSPQTGDVIKYSTIETGYYSTRYLGAKRIIS